MGCGCGPCAVTDRALRGDPAARKLLALETGIGGMLPEIVWPSDVRERKLRIDPSMVATDAAVERCGALAPGEREAWKAFYAAWRVWFAAPEPLWFGASNDWENTKALEGQLAGWQAQLRSKCEIPGPVVVDDTGLDLSGLKWVAAAVIVVAAVYGVKTIVR